MPRKKPPEEPAPEGSQTSPGDQAKNKPAHEIRIGRVRATLWLNEHEQGPWYSIVFQRSYKDQEGHWKSAASFGRDDLLPLAEVSRMAWAWIARQQGAHGVGQTNGNGGTEETPIPI